MPLLKPTRGLQLNKSHPLARGVVGCWLFNEGSGTKVFDLSKNGHDGTEQSDVIWKPGKFGLATYYTDGDDRFTFTAINLGTENSGIFWVKLGTEGVQVICGHIAYNNGGYILTLSGTTAYYSADGSYVSVSHGQTVSNWNCWAVSRNGTSVTFYCNGKQVGTTQTLGANNDLTVSSIGSYNGGSTGIYDGYIDHGLLFNYALSAAEIALLYREPFCMFEPALSCALRYAPAGQVVYFGGSSNAQSSLSAVVKVTREISGSINPSADLATLVKLIKKLLGTSGGTADVTALLKPTLRITATLVGLAGISGSLALTGEAVLGGIVNAVSALASTATLTYKPWLSVSLETERKWLKEALFSGMTANAFKLSTVLSLGWFWMRQAGCSVLYRGLSMEQIDFANILAVAEQDACTISPPSYIPHSSGSTYFYVIRRFNNCGYQEQTLAAAVRVSIEANNKLALPQPNNPFACRVEQVVGNRIQLLWFYCPLEQESKPMRFKVYYDGGTGQINYENPIAAIGYQGRKFYRWQSSALDEGRYSFAVRAEDAAGTENSSLARLRIQLGTISPNAIDILGLVTV